jgi:cytochrome c oxidase cbb3-type subunit 3
MSDEDRLLEHNYDGIQEYDNPLPRWWVVLFWATVVFSPFYILFYHAGPGKLEIEAYNEDMIAYYDLQAQQFLAMGEITEDMLHGLMDDESMMAGAEQLFVSKCSQCHGNSGEGNIGPNLTDDYWLHGGTLVEIFNTVNEGVPAKGMMAWKTQLRPAELLSVSAYVGVMRGSEPDNAKPPQGELTPYEFVPSEPTEQPDADAGGP